MVFYLDFGLALAKFKTASPQITVGYDQYMQQQGTSEVEDG